MFLLIGMDSLLSSSEMIVLLGKSSQNSRINAPLFYTLLNILLFPYNPRWPRTREENNSFLFLSFVIEVGIQEGVYMTVS